MSRPRALFLVSLGACCLCLGVGFALARQWALLAGVAAALVPWLLTYWRPSTTLASLALLATVGLAAFGVLADVPSLWMALGATAALAAWDLRLLEQDLGGQVPDRGLERQHYLCLAPVMLVGALAAVAGRAFELRIPFGWMALLVVLALVVLDRAARRLREGGR